MIVLIGKYAHGCYIDATDLMLVHCVGFLSTYVHVHEVRLCYVNFILAAAIKVLNLKSHHINKVRPQKITYHRGEILHDEVQLEVHKFSCRSYLCIITY